MNMVLLFSYCFQMFMKTSTAAGDATIFRDIPNKKRIKRDDLAGSGKN